MTKKTLIAILLACLTQLASADIGGFEHLEWDMTRQEVAQAYSNFEEWDEEDISILSGKRVVRNRYGLKNYTAATCPFSAKLEFLENRLSQVILEQQLSSLRSCRFELLAQLSQRYGKQPTIDSSGSAEVITWTTKDAAVVLRVFKLDSGLEHSAVIYTSTISLQRLLKPKRL